MALSYVYLLCTGIAIATQDTRNKLMSLAFSRRSAYYRDQLEVTDEKVNKWPEMLFFFRDAKLWKSGLLYPVVHFTPPYLTC